MSNILNIWDSSQNKYIGIPALVGMSAYEIYKKNGGTLSEVEWLESLKGQTPYIGENGNWWIETIDTGIKAKAPTVDNTLTISGAAADSKAVGDNFTEISNELNNAVFFSEENDENNDPDVISAVNVEMSDGTKVENAIKGIESEIDNLNNAIPDYWKSHLDSKIAIIKALQDVGGKDCFSFVVMTDIHYESNLGKKAPLLAKYIMDECGIKYALCLGDSHTRHGANHNKQYMIDEWEEIEKMFYPIRDRLLLTQGNHDGSFGVIDINNDGVADDINKDGIIDSYDKNVYNFTPQELYNRIFRKINLVGNACFDEKGSAYYIDDMANKVRYIMLNTHINDYEENADGTAKYNNMTHFRFGQTQYDMVIEALKGITNNTWSVIIGCHVPLDRTQEYIYWGGERSESGSLAEGSIADCTVMQRLLNSYHNKESYTGSFAGTSSGGLAYTNYADKSSADWATGQRISSSNGALSSNDTTDVTNYIPCVVGDKVHFKNCTVNQSQRLAFYDSDKTYLGVLGCSTLVSSSGLTIDSATGITTYHKVGATGQTNDAVSTLANTAYVRFCVDTGSTEPIITVNEEIVESSNDEAYDSVTISADFTNAKGELVALFSGHVHEDKIYVPSYSWNNSEHSDFPIITTRSDGRVENTTVLMNERIVGTTTEQSFDVFTINKKEKKIYATKIGCGVDRNTVY